MLLQHPPAVDSFPGVHAPSQAEMLLQDHPVPVYSQAPPATPKLSLTTLALCLYLLQ